MTGASTRSVDLRGLTLEQARDVVAAMLDEFVTDSFRDAETNAMVFGGDDFDCDLYDDANEFVRAECERRRDALLLAFDREFAKARTSHQHGIGIASAAVRRAGGTKVQSEDRRGPILYVQFCARPLSTRLRAIASTPFLPAWRASSTVHSCAVPFACTALPPLVASSCCRSLDIEAKPRSWIDMDISPRFSRSSQDETAR